MFIMQTEPVSSVIINQPDFADLVRIVGYPILDNLPGIVFAGAVTALVWWFLRKLRK